jgi:hypothetical protein
MAGSASAGRIGIAGVQVIVWDLFLGERVASSDLLKQIFLVEAFEARNILPSPKIVDPSLCYFFD